ncbi:MAG: AMIN domain-containing protein [Thermodesulfobacteriota bacterium]
MFETKAAGYSRTFYLAAVVIWTGAVGLMFITAVWGGFYGMMDAMMSAREARHMAQSLPAGPTPDASAPFRPDHNPFEQAAPAGPPAGWAVSEVEKGVHHLELRAEKLFRPGLAPDRPAAPPVESNVIKEAITQPEPARAKAPAGPPLMRGELGVVNAVKYDPGDVRFQMTLATTAPPEKVTYFFLDNPRRLAVNLQGVWRNLAPRNTEFKSGFIARAAVGEHPDYVRVTLHFRDPNAPKPADPVLNKLKDGLGVSLTAK